MLTLIKKKQRFDLKTLVIEKWLFQNKNHLYPKKKLRENLREPTRKLTPMYA